MAYLFKPAAIEMEDMLLEIADRNGVKKYNFALYMPTFFDYDGVVPHTLICALSNEPGQLKTPLDNLYRDVCRKAAAGASTRQVSPKDGFDIIFSDHWNGEIDDICRSCLGIKSLFLTEKNHYRHMKHIDFGIQGDVHGNEIEHALEELNAIKTGNGWLVFSGNSYHFHGMDSLDHMEWKRYMGMLAEQAEKKDTALDEKWPGMQLARGCSILRLTEAPNVADLMPMKPKPVVIGKIEEK